MASKEECKCINSMMDTLVNASNLSKSSKDIILSRNPDIIKTDAEILKKEIEKLEYHCAIPIRDHEISFFMEGRYQMAKENLENALKSDGKDRVAANLASDRFYSFIIDNAARMVRCPNLKESS